MRIGPLATIAALLLPSAVHADPQPLGGERAGSVAVGADGAAAVALGDRRGTVAVRRAAPGAEFGPARRVLGPLPLDRLSDSVVDTEGGGVVLFERRRAYRRVRSSVFGPAGGPGSVRTISTRGHTARYAVLGASPAGETVAAWVQYDGARSHVEAAVRAAGANTFGAPQRLSGAVPRDTLIDVAVGEHGDAVVSWRANGAEAVLSAAVRRAGEGFGPAQAVASQVVEVALAVGPDGGVALALLTLSGELPPPQGYPNASEAVALRIAARPAGATRFTLGPVLERGVEDGFTLDNLDADVATGGRVALVSGYSREVSVDPEYTYRNAIHFYEGALGGALARTAELGATTDGGGIGAGVALGDDGSTAVGWDAPVPNHPGDPTARGRYTIALRPAGGSFGAPRSLGPEVQGSRTAALRVLAGGSVFAVIDTWDMDAGDDTFALRG